MTSERSGIAAGGNWIIDHVKTISFWPAQDTLANIIAEETGTGGSPYNVLVDLARFDVGLDLHGVGLVGEDSGGEFILNDCARWGIDATLLRRVAGTPTAYTDVMTVTDTGRRTFFHHRGANALFAPEHVPVDQLPSRIFHLGYLLLLDALDAADPDYGTRAARLLAAVRAAGIRTSIDVVSEDSDRFRRIVPPALRHADYCIINEIEAERTTGITVRQGDALDGDAMVEAAQELIARGVHRLAVVHAPELAVAVTAERDVTRQPTHDLPAGFVRGTAGAGDAFLAGVLTGLHESWELADTLRFANAAAASCLRHPTTTGGVENAEAIWKLARSVPLRRPE